MLEDQSRFELPISTPQSGEAGPLPFPCLCGWHAPWRTPDISRHGGNLHDWTTIGHSALRRCFSRRRQMGAAVSSQPREGWNACAERPRTPRSHSHHQTCQASLAECQQRADAGVASAAAAPPEGGNTSKSRLKLQSALKIQKPPCYLDPLRARVLLTLAFFYLSTHLWTLRLWRRGASFLALHPIRPGPSAQLKAHWPIPITNCVIPHLDHNNPRVNLHWEVYPRIECRASFARASLPTPYLAITQCLALKPICST